MKPIKLLEPVKENLILSHDKDDELLLRLIAAAINYAESYQHLPDGHYAKNAMPPMTEQAIIMLSSHLFESRDGSTGGFFADNVAAGNAARETIDALLRLERRWSV